jgi:hypothetical protein
MSRKWMLGALLAVALFGASRFISATEPQPAANPPATPAAQPAPEQVPAPEADEPDTKIKPMPQPKRPEALQGNKPVAKEEQPPVDKAKKEKQSLVQPPGLLSRAPAIAPFTRPGLGKLNLNASSTTIEQIQRLPGVGVTWAPRILAGRPYRTFGEMARDGIPFTTIDALSREVELGP